MSTNPLILLPKEKGLHRPSWVRDGLSDSALSDGRDRSFAIWFLGDRGYCLGVRAHPSARELLTVGEPAAMLRGSLWRGTEWGTEDCQQPREQARKETLPWREAHRWLQSWLTPWLQPCERVWGRTNQLSGSWTPDHGSSEMMFAFLKLPSLG